jgi:hypothetical protein
MQLIQLNLANKNAPTLLYQFPDCPPLSIKKIEPDAAALFMCLLFGGL